MIYGGRLYLAIESPIEIAIYIDPDKSTTKAKSSNSIAS